MTETDTPTPAAAASETASPTPVVDQPYTGSHPPGPSQAFLYPSPARGSEASLAFTMAEAGTLTARIWNANGDLVARFTENRQAGAQAARIPLGGFAVGVYLLKVDFRYDSGASASLGVQKFSVVR